MEDAVTQARLDAMLAAKAERRQAAAAANVVTTAVPALAPQSSSACVALTRVRVRA